MASPKQRFFDDYDIMADDTAHSSRQFFVDNLRRWLNLIEETPQAADVAKALGHKMALQEWTDAYTTHPHQIGGGNIKWPPGRDARLGAQLDLFRIFERGEWDAMQFGFTTLQSGRHASDAIRAVVDQVFTPMARDLRRTIDDFWIEKSSEFIPASDRTVTLKDNAYGNDLVERLAALEDQVTKTNEIIEPEEREQTIAEISAATRLLRATRVRLAPLLTLLRPVLAFLMRKFADVTIGNAAKLVWDKVNELLFSLTLPPM